MFKIKKLIKESKRRQRTIVFPEVSFSDRTLEAVKILQKKKICKVMLVGDASALLIRDKSLEKFDIVNPATFQDREVLIKTLYEKRKEKGMTREQAEELEKDPYYFATLLVECGYADGMIAGAETSTANTVRPALQIIKSKNKAPVSSCFLVYGKNDFLDGKALILSDCGVLEKPTAEQLSAIAAASVESAKQFGISTPKVAFLSYSTKGSAKSEDVTKVQQAYEMFKKKNKDVLADGELQFDAAMVKSVADHKAPNSEIQGDANVLIFPDINAGNICYKTIQYIGGLTAVGPILQNLKKPVNDLSRGCSVNDIVILAVITSLQCEWKEDENDNKKENKGDKKE